MGAWDGRSTLPVACTRPTGWRPRRPGEICDGCDEVVTKAQMFMKGLSGKGSGVQFHVACFYVWDVERQVLGHEPSGPA